MKLPENIHLKTLALSLVALFAVLLLGNSFSYLDNDFGWHILAGKDIIAKKQVPHTADFSHTLPGAGWVDHEWLIDVLTYSIYDQFGYIATAVFFAGIVMGVFAILYRYRFARMNQAGFWFFVIGFLGYFAARHSLGVRMQEVTLLGVVLELLIIDRFQKSLKAENLLWLIPLFWIWSNLHAGFLVGLALLVGWLALMAILNFARKWQDRLGLVDFSLVVPGRHLAAFSLFAFLAAAATLVNPYGWKMYDFFFSFGNTYYLTAISEWMPFYFFPQQPLVVFYLCMTVSALFLLATKAVNRSKGVKIDLWWLSLVILFLLMALKSRRHTALLVVVSIPWLVDLFSKEFIIEGVRGFLASKRARLAMSLATAAAVGTAAFFFTKVAFTNKPFEYYCGYFPCAAVAELKSTMPMPERILNDFNWGGYLLWQWPGLQLFVDGRQPQHQYGNRTILEEYHQFFKEGQAEEYLKKHRIDMVLLGKQREPKVTWFNKLLFGIKPDDLKAENHLFNYLGAAKGWNKCFEDDTAIAFCSSKLEQSTK